MQPRLIWVLRIILFIVLAGVFLFFVPIQEIIDAIRGASPYYFWMSYLLGFPASYLGAARLWLLTRKQGIQASPLKLMEINYVVKFYSFFSPASAVGSLMRWYKLSGNGKSAEALTAVAVLALAILYGPLLVNIRNSFVSVPAHCAFGIALILALAAVRHVLTSIAGSSNIRLAIATPMQAPTICAAA